MKETFKSVFYPRNNNEKSNIDFLNFEEAGKAQAFHESFPVYSETPLAELKNLAKEIGVKNIHVKDESYRFGLNAFKVLGGSYAIGRLIADKIGEDIKNLTATKMISKEVKDKTGDMVFVTATDGNHGRGVAWTANQLNQKSVVYMPKGSAIERLNNILAEGSEASIMDMNYDEAVRLADKNAKEKGWIVIQDTAWEGYEDIPTWIMQGYMTLGFEIVKQLEETKAEAPTHIFLQAGVGSLAGAVCGFFANYYKGNQPKIVVVEPNKADCIYRTAEANDGKLHFVTGDLNTIMAGLACGEPNSIGWNVLKDYADAFISCPDYVAADGMRVMASPLDGDTKVISGESGAATLGCVYNILTDDSLVDLKGKLGLNEDSRLLFISTEGDTDKQNYRNVVWNGKDTRYDAE
ncbi:MAG TPA: diaminopropionate ammonia-lyase [Lachnoclostridium phytofermentans]|uniref:Diaminopropionate ammonia-lyase n=1 Tax=Lachnoclostridium phytofermentans TaxID=66219 RepID=A0A3D2X7E1_9FIRM|nr:diaminopropionate ammonia-lyase [Lachnoclostridium sp.]HCL02268.1 diaminopropionate ammonia-lyase [Lachnoclostridium phytofermentans]